MDPICLQIVLRAIEIGYPNLAIGTTRYSLLDSNNFTLLKYYNELSNDKKAVVSK